MPLGGALGPFCAILLHVAQGPPVRQVRQGGPQARQRGPQVRQRVRGRVRRVRHQAHLGQPRRVRGALYCANVPLGGSLGPFCAILLHVRVRGRVRLRQTPNPWGILKDPLRNPGGCLEESWVPGQSLVDQGWQTQGGTGPVQESLSIP